MYFSDRFLLGLQIAIELTKFPSHDTHLIRAVNTADRPLKAGLVADT
jgi:hypothetical protein